MAENNKVVHSNEELMFAGLFKAMTIAQTRRAEFLSMFPDGSIFKNEWHLLYILIRSHTRIAYNREFIAIFCKQQQKLIKGSSSINLADFSIGTEDAYITFVNTCIQRFEQCEALYVSDEDFATAMESYRLVYIEESSIKLLEQGAEIVANGLQVSGNKTLSGYTDMNTYVMNGLTKLNNLMDKKNRQGIIVYDSETEDEEENELKLVSPYGIPTLDAATGGMYETDMISILAPPKGGKSRISAFFFHNALVHGVNCVSWSLENGVKGFEALIRACHYNWFYNKDKDTLQRRVIDADMIRKNALKGEEKELEAASWLDLRTNPAYGRWANIDDDFVADTFLTVLNTAVDTVNAKLILVDYLQLVTGDGKLAKNERIGICYQKSLQYLHSKKIVGLFPAQIKQAALSELAHKSDAELENVELRDAGGETSEVIRTPSVLMLLYADSQGIAAGELKLLSIPSRNSKPFKPVNLYADFAVCDFVERADK